MIKKLENIPVDNLSERFPTPQEIVDKLNEVIEHINEEEPEVFSSKDFEEWSSGKLEVPTRDCPTCNKVKDIYGI